MGRLEANLGPRKTYDIQFGQMTRFLTTQARPLTSTKCQGKAFGLSKAVAEILRKKAQGDLHAAIVLANADPPMDDEMVGLHLQQAVEKAAKVLLTWRDIKYPSRR
jgi:hypothetical protein